MGSITGWILVLLLTIVAHTFASDPSDPKRFHFITLPTKGPGPCDLDTGPDGESIWFRDAGSDIIGTYNVKTRQITEYAIPGNSSSATPGEKVPQFIQCFVRTGKDGYVYSGAPHSESLIRINPKTNEIGSFQTGLGVEDAFAAETGLYSAFPNNNIVEFFNYKTTEITTHVLPRTNSGPVGIHADGQGFIWITQYNYDGYARLNQTSGKIEEFVALDAANRPQIVRVLTENRYLWIVANGLIKLDTLGFGETAYGYSGNLTGSENTLDPSGNIWLALNDSNELLYLNQSTGYFVTVTPPNDTVTSNRPIPIHYGPLNAIWFTDRATGQLAYYSLD